MMWTQKVPNMMRPLLLDVCSTSSSMSKLKFSIIREDSLFSLSLNHLLFTFPLLNASTKLSKTTEFNTKFSNIPAHDLRSNLLQPIIPLLNSLWLPIRQLSCWCDVYISFHYVEHSLSSFPLSVSRRRLRMGRLGGGWGFRLRSFWLGSFSSWNHRWRTLSRKIVDP